MTIEWDELLQLPVNSWWGLLAALTLLVMMTWWIIRLVARVNEDTDPAEADRQMLLAINELHREGDLDNEEFRSIKSQLVERLSNDVQGASDSRKTAKTASAKSAGTGTGVTPQTDNDDSEGPASEASDSDTQDLK